MNRIYLTHPANLEAVRSAIGWTGGRVATDDRLPVTVGGEPYFVVALSAHESVPGRLLDRWAADLTHEAEPVMWPRKAFFEAAGVPIAGASPA